jgi:hypothetical protein
MTVECPECQELVDIGMSKEDITCMAEAELRPNCPKHGTWTVPSEQCKVIVDGLAGIIIASGFSNYL